MRAEWARYATKKWADRQRERLSARFDRLRIRTQNVFRTIQSAEWVQHHTPPQATGAAPFCVTPPALSSADRDDLLIPQNRVHSEVITSR